MIFGRRGAVPTTLTRTLQCTALTALWQRGAVLNAVRKSAWTYRRKSKPQRASSRRAFLSGVHCCGRTSLPFSPIPIRRRSLLVAAPVVTGPPGGFGTSVKGHMPLIDVPKFNSSCQQSPLFAADRGCLSPVSVEEGPPVC